MTLRRIARWGDGWIMLAHPPGEAARAAFASLRSHVAAAGRDPATVGIEVWVFMDDGDEAAWRDELRLWRDSGVTHVTLNSVFGRYHHRRIPGRSVSAHLTAIERYRKAVADLL